MLFRSSARCFELLTHHAKTITNNTKLSRAFVCFRKSLRSALSSSLVCNCGCGPVKLRNVNGERFIIGLGPILQNAEGTLLPQKDRPVSRAAKMDPGVNSVTE